MKNEKRKEFEAHSSRYLDEKLRRYLLGNIFNTSIFDWILLHFLFIGIFTLL